jgi:hypothetical protein
VDEIVTTISAAVLAAIEPRLAAFENNGKTFENTSEVVVPDPGWDCGPQKAGAIDPKLRHKRRQLQWQRIRLAKRRVWGGVDGAVRQARELVHVDDALARIERVIFISQRSQS